MSDERPAVPAVVRDEQLRGAVGGPAARALLASIVAEDVVPLKRSVVPRILSTAATVVVLTAAGVVGTSLLQPGPGSTSYANSAISVALHGDVYVAEIKDPLAESAEYAEAFQAVGKDVRIELVPVSPRFVGQLLEAGFQGRGRGWTDLTGPDCDRNPAGCTTVLSVSADTTGQVRYRIGRAALPGEKPQDPAHG
ncbi:hypothetical protein [Amycolatopsis sp. NPDC021455]|uniref:hypothetical protein n=1 Tax=Amycolatopsis sp. NPDC021455 TaxID=3154901 RepID=UPI0033D5AEF4